MGCSSEDAASSLLCAFHRAYTVLVSEENGMRIAFTCAYSSLLSRSLVVIVCRNERLDELIRCRLMLRAFCVELHRMSPFRAASHGKKPNELKPHFLMFLSSSCL